MRKFTLSIKNSLPILALGAESAGNFCIFKDGTIYISEDFGDLLNEQNFANYKKALFKELDKLSPTVVLSDLHPDFVTTHLSKELAKKYKALNIPVQHHVAHVFSSVGDRIIQNSKFKIQNSFFGIACDGTGYAEDGTVWGGEIFSFQLSASSFQQKRVGYLENQMLLGGEKAIEEPARMLIAILSKFLTKEETYKQIKEHYSKNEFELLWNQLQQNFNCIDTSSTARVLDAASLLLGFAKNKRIYKHEPADNLEKNSTSPYKLKTVVEFNEIEKTFILKTTPLFEYLLKNLHKDKKRLAATAQKYIADGLLEIVIRNQQSAISNQKNCHEDQLPVTSYQLQNVFFSGGMANNKIISSFLKSKGVYINKKIPRGDAGISFGQLVYFLLTDTRY